MDLITGLILTVIVLSIIVGALGYACYNLLKKQEVYEDWVELFRSEIGQIYGRLKEVDDKELFVRDDDVGFVYSEIMRVVKEFNDKIQ